ncbi:MAG: L-serine ammonia-lyase, iron-sulfur-dependent, subunit alpha [Candidatus Baldrarchaeia archaeon]
MVEFKTLKDLIILAEKRKRKIGEIVWEYEAEVEAVNKEIVWGKMVKHWNVMKSSIENGLKENFELPCKIAKRYAKKFLQEKKFFLDEFLSKVAARALAVSEYNSAMGLVCAAPTAGSSGVIPAALYSAAEKLGANEKEVILALFTASGIGLIIANKASISGSEAGCQAEVGAAAAMTAGALVELANGKPRQVDHAVAIALKAVMGLICDPVAGLVISPCIKRNAFGAVLAFLAAEMSLSGVESLIPADEVIEAMDSVGRLMHPDLKETARGGIATTPTGEKIRKKLFKEGRFKLE